MRLSSDALQDGRIPARYSKDGQNISPPLAWSDLPAGTEELALIFENITPRTKEPFVQWWSTKSRRISVAARGLQAQGRPERAGRRAAGPQLARQRRL